MITQITDGIKISVVSNYEFQDSNPNRNHFVYTYRISIENCGNHTVQLLRRHWYIYDGNGEMHEVEGKGVVGQQPTLEPGEVHQYVSGCNLSSGIGKMKGVYLMERVLDGYQFDVVIPEFTLMASFLFN